MIWKESKAQPCSRYTARLGDIGWNVMVIQHDDRTWHADVPLSEPRVALKATDGEAAKLEAEQLLRDKLTRALDQVNADAAVRIETRPDLVPCPVCATMIPRAAAMCRACRCCPVF